MCSKASSKECHINTDSNDIANALHTAGLTATLYEITSYLEPVATNVLFFNADKAQYQEGSLVPALIHCSREAGICLQEVTVSSCTTDLRKYFFSERVIDRWNMLTEDCVSSSTINEFKGKLTRSGITRRAFLWIIDDSSSSMAESGLCLHISWCGHTR